jgi:hypothetical protein
MDNTTGCTAIIIQKGVEKNKKIKRGSSVFGWVKNNNFLG